MDRKHNRTGRVKTTIRDFGIEVYSFTYGVTPYGQRGTLMMDLVLDSRTRLLKIPFRHNLGDHVLVFFLSSYILPLRTSLRSLIPFFP